MIKVDYILKNGHIVDGNRTQQYKANVIIRDKYIFDICTGEDKYEGETIDVSGKIISPGFIDIHSHSDKSYLRPNRTSKIYQGITTEIVGNCGVSTIPLLEKNRNETINYFNIILDKNSDNIEIKSNNILEYTKEMEKINLPINLGVLIGHGTLRGSVMGFDDRAPTEDEIDEMCEILSRELENGAFGLSLGLIYPPGSFSEKEEIMSLAKVVKENEKILAVHMRNEGDKIFKAVDEMLDIAKNTGVHLHISHLKLIGKKQWGKSSLLLEKIYKAKKEGLNISCDQYPYTATSTSLSALIPKWAHDGGTKKMLERLTKFDSRLDEDIEREIENRGGANRISISGTKGYIKCIEGLNLEQISKDLNLNYTNTVRTLLIKSKNNISAVYHSLNGMDVLNIMKEIYVSVGSDGYAFNYEDDNTNPHPRSFGTFPKFLEMVRDNNLIEIEDAIYKMTKLNADILGLKDRGVLEIGKIADITVFDYENTKDNSTFTNSRVKPSGIEHVFANGKPVLFYGKEKFLNKGKVLLR